MEEPDFWEDTEGSQKVMKELKMLKDTLKTAEELNQQYEDTGVLLEMAEEEQMKVLSERSVTESKGWMSTWRRYGSARSSGESMIIVMRS